MAIIRAIIARIVTFFAFHISYPQYVPIAVIVITFTPSASSEMFILKSIAISSIAASYPKKVPHADCIVVLMFA